MLIVGLFLFAACEPDEIIQSNSLRYSHPVFDSVKNTRNIHYRTAVSFNGKSTELFLDFSEPYGDSLETRPLIILMHGGGFIQGKREWMKELSQLFPLYGYSCANISYRLYDGKDFPLSNEDFFKSFLLAREDLVSAVDFFVNHASGIDPYHTDINNIFIAGASAGGIGALHAIPLNIRKSSNPDIEKISKTIEGDISMNQTRGPLVAVRGILSFAGAVFDTTWITSDYPDVFSVHGTSDNIVPFSEGFIHIANVISPLAAFGSELIHKQAATLGFNSVLIPDEGASHINFFKKPELWQEQAIVFLASSLWTDSLSF